MATWSDCVGAADVGGTADSFDSVGTITLNSKARQIVGLWMAGATNATTANEANLGQFQFDFSNLGFGLGVFGGPPSSGAAIATNNQGVKSEAILLRADIPAKGNVTIPINFSTHVPDPTAGASVVAGVIYTDGNVAPGFASAFPRPNALISGDSEAVADASGTTATDITALQIPSYAKRLVGIGRDSNFDSSSAAGEEMVGMIDFAGTTGIHGFAPQVYPLPAIQAPLGTEVGQPIHTPNLMDTYWPMDWDLSDAGEVTTTPQITLNAAVTGAVAHSATILWV